MEVEKCKQVMLDYIYKRHSLKVTGAPNPLRVVVIKVCSKCKLSVAFSDDNSLEEYEKNEDRKVVDSLQNTQQMLCNYLKWSMAKDCMVYKQIFVCDTCKNTHQLLHDNERYIKFIK